VALRCCTSLVEQGPPLIEAAARVQLASNEDSVSPSQPGLDDDDGGASVSSGEEIECGACLEEFPRSSMAGLSCGHMFCKPCWKVSARSSLSRNRFQRGVPHVQDYLSTAVEAGASCIETTSCMMGADECQKVRCSIDVTCKHTSPPALFRWWMKWTGRDWLQQRRLTPTIAT